MSNSPSANYKNSCQSTSTALLIKRSFVFVVLVAVIAGRLLATAQAAPSDPGQATAGEKSKEKEKPSFFTDLWQLDKETRGGSPSVTFHRTNYALGFSYNTSPNQDPWQALDPPKTMTKPEATFQLSFKAKIWQDVFGMDWDLWIAYTQRSFWQVYNFEESRPFRETDYEPEALLNFRTRFNLLGMKVRFIQVGANHQSNGQSEPLSRSWNRLVANVGLERGDFSLLLKGWYRLPESPEDDDNPGIYDYMGYGEIWGYYLVKKHRFAIMLRDNLDFEENKGAIQLEWSFPAFAQVGGYVQYFLGYGESLLDYNHKVNRIGIGFVLAEWY
jgi:phospholipase A1